MDADTLRLILFLAGIALIAGIYLWDRRKRADLRTHAVRREKAEPVVSELDHAPGEEEPEPRHAPVWRREPATAGEQREPLPEIHNGGDDAGVDEETLKRLGEIVQEEAPKPPKKGKRKKKEPPREEQISLPLDEPEPDIPQADLPRKILQLNVRVRGGGLVTGPRVLAAAEACGLEPGEMQIFHRHLAGAGQPLFSMANLVEPGVFPFDAMEGFTTPGVTLFAQLPGPMEAMQTFDQMLAAAQSLASALDGEIQDETHSDLSRQTIEHIREEIQEYGRQLRLARSRQ